MAAAAPPAAGQAAHAVTPPDGSPTPALSPAIVQVPPTPPAGTGRPGSRAGGGARQKAPVKRAPKTGYILAGILLVLVLCIAGVLAFMNKDRLIALAGIGAGKGTETAVAAGTAAKPSETLPPTTVKPTGTAAPTLAPATATVAVTSGVTEPAASVTPIEVKASETPLPPVTPTGAPGLAIQDDFSSDKTEETWKLSGAPAPSVVTVDDKRALVFVDPINVLGLKSSAVLRRQVELKPGATIEFSIQLDGSAPQDLMEFMWLAGDTEPDQLDGEASTLRAEISSNKRVYTASTDTQVMSYTDKTSLNTAVHLFAVSIKANKRVSFKVDGVEVYTTENPLNIAENKGFIAFQGKGKLSSIKISIP